MGLDGALRAKGDRFVGILNGLDTTVWDPATDADLAAPYSAADRSGKAACRADLLSTLGFDPDDDGAVIGMIGRLDPQKGFDLLADAAPRPARARRAAGRAGQRTGRPRGPVPRDRPGAPAAGRLHRAVRPGDGPQDLRRRRLLRDAVALRAVRAGPDDLAPVRHAADRPSRRRARGHGHRRGRRIRGRGPGSAFTGASVAGLLAACDAAVGLRAAGGAAWEGLLDRGMAVDFDWVTGAAPRYVDAYRRAVAIRRERVGVPGAWPRADEFRFLTSALRRPEGRPRRSVARSSERRAGVGCGSLRADDGARTREVKTPGIPATRRSRPAPASSAAVNSAGCVRCGECGAPASVTMWSAPIRASKPGSAASGTRPPAAGSPRISHIGIPSAAGSEMSARPPSQSPLSSRTARAASTSTWVSASALARTSSSGQAGFSRPTSRTAVSRSGIRHLGRVRGHLARCTRDGIGRRIEQDEGRGPDAGDRQGRGDHPAPAVADDLESGTSRPVARIQAATSAAVSRNRWWPVQWPVCPWPGRSAATTCRPDAASAGPDPPPDPRRRGDAVDEDRAAGPRGRPRPAPRTGSRPRRSRIADPDRRRRPVRRGRRRRRAADRTCPDGTSLQRVVQRAIARTRTHRWRSRPVRELWTDRQAGTVTHIPAVGR